MKKYIILLLGITLAYSCSTSNDGNGNNTTTVVPVAPSNLVVSSFSYREVHLLWTDNSNNETEFYIERKTGNQNFTNIGIGVSNNSTYVDNQGLIPGFNYTYRVCSKNSAGISVTYSNEVNISTTPLFLPGSNITDVDGNIYNTIKIGNQTWMKSNLKVTHYRNGNLIPNVIPSIVYYPPISANATTWASLTNGAFCNYENSTVNGSVYGKLYNYYAVNDSRGLAPSGWHVPTDAEWLTLFSYVGGIMGTGSGVNLNNCGPTGDHFKEIGTLHWSNNNSSATNSTGFTGFAAGILSPYLSYDSLGLGSYWWSSTLHINTQSSESSANGFILNNTNNKVESNLFELTYGLSIRCIKD